MILKFKDINEDFLGQNLDLNIDTFNTYTKNKFPNEITSIMMWLRMHKKPEYNDIKVKLSLFLKETNLSLEKLTELIKNKDKTVLINFTITIDNDYIIFSDLNKKVEEKSK